MTHLASSTTDPSQTVGVRELRQNLSKYLTRVKAGESLVVTERGKEVARVVPSNVGLPGYEELAKLGATVPTARLADVVAEFKHLPSSPAGTADVLVAEQRRERV